MRPWQRHRTARQMAVKTRLVVLAGQREFAWNRLAVTTKRRREIELRAAYPFATVTAVRRLSTAFGTSDRERAAAPVAERAYTRFIGSESPRSLRQHSLLREAP
jgi:hypothetical protein